MPSPAPSEAVRETDLDAGFRLYKAGNYSESFEHLAKAISQGQPVVFTIKHRHGGAGRILSDDAIGLADICLGQLVFNRDSLRFRSLSTALEGTQREFKNHDFVASLGEIYEVKVRQEPWISKDLREAREEPAMLHIRVGVKKGNKLEKKNYDFYPPEAFFDATDPNNRVIRCPGCRSKADLFARLLQSAIEGRSGTPNPK